MIFELCPLPLDMGKAGIQRAKLKPIDGTAGIFPPRYSHPHPFFTHVPDFRNVAAGQIPATPAAPGQLAACGSHGWSWLCDRTGTTFAGCPDPMVHRQPEPA